MAIQAYGLNYQGSKNKIAEWVVDHLPYGKNFYDLFGGGGAVTHAAIKSGKFKKIILNDINPLCQCFVKAAHGDYTDAELFRWRSRTEYEQNRLNDELTFFLYSFGGNGENYLYARELEPFKKALHYARVFGDNSALTEMGCPSSSRKWIYEHNELVKANYTDWYLSNVMHTDLTYADFKGKLQVQIKDREEELRQYLLDALKQSGLKSQREVGIRLGTNMERHYFGKSQWAFPTEEMYAKMQTFMPLPRPYSTLFGLDDTCKTDIRALISLEKLTSFYFLENYQNARRLKSLHGLCPDLIGLQQSYDEVEIAPNSVIYCDPPYYSTSGYIVGGFDHEKFYEWCSRQKELTIISEYYMPSEAFIPIAQTTICCTLSATNNAKQAVEKLYIPKHQWGLYKQKQGLLF